MKRQIKIRFLATLVCAASLFAGCKNEVNLPDQDESKFNQVYMPQAVNGVVNQTFTVSNESHELIFGAGYGGIGYPEKDIPVQFQVDQVMADAYNTANITNYEMMPSSAFALSGTQGVIRKGGLTTDPLKLSIKTSGAGAIRMFKTYILPISISSDFKINTLLKTTYYLITAEPDIAQYPDYDKSAWKIVDFSSEEKNGEGPNNGRAIFTIDGDINTFWHSQWKGASPGPPHHVTIDMGEVKTLHGVNVTARQVEGSSGKPERMKIQVSLDNVTWKDAADLQLAVTVSQQKKWLTEFVDARYVKFIIVSAYNSNSAHLGELGAY